MEYKTRILNKIKARRAHESTYMILVYVATKKN